MAAVEFDFNIGPQNFAGPIDRRHAAAAEDGVDGLAIGDGRGGGPRIFAFFATGDLRERGRVPKNFAGLAIQRNDMAIGAIRGDARHKNAVAPNDRRGPALAGDGGFPNNVGIGGPSEWEIFRSGNSLARGAAEFGPVFRLNRGEEEEAKANKQKSIHLNPIFPISGFAMEVHHRDDFMLAIPLAKQQSVWEPSDSGPANVAFHHAEQIGVGSYSRRARFEGQ